MAFGANQPSHHGEAAETVLAAMALLGDLGLICTAQSALFQTPAFPAGAGPDYVNAVVQVESRFSAPEVLALCHSLEARFGRTREVRWGSRCLDIDLLDHAGEVLPSRKVYDHWASLPLEAQLTATPEQLILPHPRIAERAFVLVPLADVCPDWVHPVSGRNVAGMIADLAPENVAEVVAL